MPQAADDALPDEVAGVREIDEFHADRRDDRGHTGQESEEDREGYAGPGRGNEVRAVVDHDSEEPRRADRDEVPRVDGGEIVVDLLHEGHRRGVVPEITAEPSCDLVVVTQEVEREREDDEDAQQPGHDR